MKKFCGICATAWLVLTPVAVALAWSFSVWLGIGLLPGAVLAWVGTLVEINDEMKRRAEAEARDANGG